MFRATDLVCPISAETTDHNAVRVTGLVTIAALGLFAVTGSPFVMVPVAADYVLRAFTRDPSPMQLLGRGLARAARVPVKTTARAPKVFAARVGLLFALVAAVLSFFAPWPAVAVALSLLFFNVLDSVFDFCVGCWTYTWIVLPLRTAWERVRA